MNVYQVQLQKQKQSKAEEEQNNKLAEVQLAENSLKRRHEQDLEVVRIEIQELDTKLKL